MATSPTGGFARASVMPDAAVTDPRLLALDYSSILRGAGQGLQLAGAYGQTRDAALARQEAAALAEPRLAAMRSQYELAPQLGRNQLELSNYAVAKGGLPIQLDDASYGVNEQIRLDSQGQPYATPDVMLQQTVTEFDPVTRTRRQVQRNVKPLSTIEQQAAAEAAAVARSELNDIRRAQAEQTVANQAANVAAREASLAERERMNNEIIALRKTTEDRLGSNKPEPAEAAAKQLAQLEKVRIADGRTLAEYMQDTYDVAGNVQEEFARDKNNKIVYEDAPGWGTGDQAKKTGKRVATNPQAEALVKQYRAISSRVVQEPMDGAITPAAPASAAPPTLTPAQYQSAPSGTVFYGEDGVLRRKP